MSLSFNSNLSLIGRQINSRCWLGGGGSLVNFS